jgi:hypothetical protein
MPQQSLVIGARERYEALPGTTRASANIAQSPATVKLRCGSITAQVDTALKGRYDRSGSVSEIQVFRASHDIDGTRATLEVQRFVKAVQVIGPQMRRTSGTGYLKWTDFDLRPAERDIAALCASQIRAAGLQDDGPRGSGKLKMPSPMRFEIHDAPGLATSTAAHFPYAMLTDFIMRVIATPAGSGAAEVAEFRYQCYFEFPQDPYPKGMRDQAFVPTVSGNQSDYVEFTAIGERFERESKTATLPKPKARVTQDLDSLSTRPKTTDKPSSRPVFKEW